MNQKEAFIDALAEYMVRGQAGFSIALEMGKPSAKEWAAVRNASPVGGYPTKAEAIAVLNRWFATWTP